MLNNIFPFTVQATVQAIGPGENSGTPIVAPFESAALWIDDEIILWALDY